MLALLLVSVYCSPAQTLRERIEERRTAHEPEAETTAAFPAKGRLFTAKHMTLSFGGVERSYLIQPVHKSGIHPVLILLHGGTETAEQVWRQTSLPTLGERDGFIVVAPNAVDRHWNDGRNATLGGGGPSAADDVGFLKALIAEVIASFHGDPKTIFMIGASNGGFMTMHFACKSGDLLRAAGNVVSDLPVDQKADCPCRKPLPWLSLNGTSDPLIPFGGEPAGAVKNGQKQPALLSADDTFAFWANRNHCASEVQSTRLPHREATDSTWVEKRVRTGGAGETSCVQYVIHGGGHIWPNAQPAPIVERFIGLSNQDIDAGEVIWEFFRGTLQK